MNKFNRVMRSRRAGQRGFTLIELLVVIAVLAVLAAIVIFNVTGVKNRGNAAACTTDVKSVQTSIDSYINDNPNATEAQLEALFPGGLAPGTAIPAATKAGVSNVNNPDNAPWVTLIPSYIHTAPAVGECAVTSMTLTWGGPAAGNPTPIKTYGVLVTGN
jgi:prepilin-type N-terminal cleavage/methylation domain-containing protein